MGTLLEEASRLKKKPGTKCGVAKLGLPPELLTELEAAMDTEVYTSSLAAALTERGYEVKTYTLNRHRQRVCACR